jgi:hypothetical protein
MILAENIGPLPVDTQALALLSYGTATAYPCGISKDRKTVFGRTNAGTTMRESTDDGATWSSVHTFSD